MTGSCGDYAGIHYSHLAFLPSVFFDLRTIKHCISWSSTVPRLNWGPKLASSPPNPADTRSVQALVEWRDLTHTRDSGDPYLPGKQWHSGTAELLDELLLALMLPVCWRVQVSCGISRSFCRRISVGHKRDSDGSPCHQCMKIHTLFHIPILYHSQQKEGVLQISNP